MTKTIFFPDWLKENDEIAQELIIRQFGPISNEFYAFLFIVAPELFEKEENLPEELKPLLEGPSKNFGKGFNSLINFFTDKKNVVQFDKIYLQFVLMNIIYNSIRRLYLQYPIISNFKEKEGTTALNVVKSLIIPLECLRAELQDYFTVIPEDEIIKKVMTQLKRKKYLDYELCNFNGKKSYRITNMKDPHINLKMANAADKTCHFDFLY